MRALFVCTGEAHARIFAPVLAAAESHGFECCILSLDPQNYQGGERELERLKRNWMRLQAPALGQRLSEHSPIWIWHYVLRFIRPAVSFLLQEYRPGVVVLGTDSGFVERAIIRAARKLGISTLLLQHGWLFRPQLRSGFGLRARFKAGARRSIVALLNSTGFPDLATDDWGRGACDWIAVLGPSSARTVRNLGASGARIVCSGMPCYDRVLKDGSSRMSRRPQSNGNRKYVIATTAVLVDLRDRRAHAAQLTDVETAIEAIERADGRATIKVRPHPREDVNEYEREFGAESVLTGGDIFDAIGDAWCVLTSFSTVFLDALVLQRSVALTAFSYDTLAVGTIVPHDPRLPSFRTVSELEDHLRRLVNDAPYREGWHRDGQDYLLDHVSGLDGRATDTVTDLLLRACAARAGHERPESGRHE